MRMICVAEEAEDVKDATIATILYHKYQDFDYSKQPKFSSKPVFWVGGGWGYAMVDIKQA